jgi:acyl dehydratase
MPIPWEDLQPGTETGRFEVIVTDEMIDAYLDSMDNDHPWFVKGGASPGGGRIAPPDLVPKLAMTDLFQSFIHRDIGPNIRAKQAFTFYEPMRPGMTVKAVGRLVEKYERRGKHFITLEALFTDDKGTKLVLDRRTQLVLSPDFKMKK